MTLQGDPRRGFGTVGRRLRGLHDESNPSDMVEHHVIGQGMDERAVADLLRARFGSVDLLPYWSNQSGVAQRRGELMGLRNTFAARAVGRRA